MKKNTLLLALLVIVLNSNAQIRTDSVKIKPVLQVQRTAKIVPASKAVVIRKDLSRLKIQVVQLKDSIDITKKEMDILIESMKNDLDSMSEMGETESLRLQMAMDRLSRMMSTLSNILKKVSDTQQSITRNLK